MRLAISSTIPNKHVSIPPQEKVKPIGILLSHHPLVNECIRVAHDNSWFIQIRSLIWIFRVNLNIFSVSWWEKHRINHWLIPALDWGDHKLFAFKVLLQNQFALIQVSEQQIWGLILWFTNSFLKETGARTPPPFATAQEAASNSATQIAYLAGLFDERWELSDKLLQLFKLQFGLRIVFNCRSGEPWGCRCLSDCCILVSSNNDVISIQLF